MMEIQRKRKELDDLILEMKDAGVHRNLGGGDVPPIDMYSVYGVHNLKMEVEERQIIESKTHQK